MNFRPFAGTHVRITEKEAIPPDHISQKPCLSWDPNIYVLCSQGSNAEWRIKVQDDLFPFFLLESRGWLRKTANKNDNPIFIYNYTFDKVDIFTRFGLAFTLKRSNEGLRKRYRKGKIWLVSFWQLNTRGAIGGSWGGIQIYETSVQGLSPPPLHLFPPQPPHPPASPGELARKRNAGPGMP